MVSIVIAAHNEEAVLGATLAALPRGSGVEVIVVPNGCSDNTAAIARRHDATKVVVVAEGGKPGALNAGDAAATTFPRIYLDADIVPPPGTVEALVQALDRPGILAAVPGRRLNTAGRPWPVRAWAAINVRLPVFVDGLFGRGMIALSEEARSRFGAFPQMVADDLFLDSLFSPDEKAHVAAPAVTVEAPFTSRDLINRLVRVRRGSAAMRGAEAELGVPIRRADRWSWLRDVVAREPLLLPAGLVYAAIMLLAALRARHGDITAMDWGRDESTRRHGGV